MDLWIKICGITRPEDARAAVERGVDALGLVLYAPSPRAVTAARVKDIVAGLPSRVRVYALFVNPSREEVEAVVAFGGVNRLQFHGDESAEFCAGFGLPYMKALRVGAGDDAMSLSRRAADYESAEAILLDTYHPAVAGGSGECFDWGRVEGLRGLVEQPMVLAGGLKPGNVAEAVRRVRPWGVDVSSGVEVRAGVKDMAKVQRFIEEARHV